MKKQVIEYAGIPVGISVPEGDRLKFIAVKFPVIDLDGATYESIADLRRAIHTHMALSRNEVQGSPAGSPPANDDKGSAFSAA